MKQRHWVEESLDLHVAALIYKMKSPIDFASETFHFSVSPKYSLYSHTLVFIEANTLINDLISSWRAAQTEQPTYAASLIWDLFRPLRELKAIFFKGNAHLLL